MGSRRSRRSTADRVATAISRAATVGRLLRLTLICAAVAISACSRDTVLPGERVAVRLDPVPLGATQGLSQVSLPPAQVNSEWTHRNGSSRGRVAHPALSPAPQLRWSVDIGEGSDRRRRLLTGPVVSGGLIYTLDAAGRLSATTPAAETVWSVSVVPPGQNPDSGPGGGMAVADGVLFVTTGFGETLALDPRSGGIYWRRTFEGPIRAAPTVAGGRVYVVLRSDVAYALDPTDGSALWLVQGTGGTGLLGGASIATQGQIVAVPFASGEVLGLLTRNGLQIWGTAVTGGRRTEARDRITDISGDPVFDGGVVYASNQSGRTVALDAETGERFWTMPEGSYGPAWPVGGSLFLLSDQGELVRASRETGEILWLTQLPEYSLRRRVFRSPVRGDAFAHYGPILAGGRLWVASGDGFLRGFDPTNGALIYQTEIPGGAAAAPAVAGGVMYVVGADGRLFAFQ